MIYCSLDDFSSKVSETIIFGKYPTQIECDLLLKTGVLLFIDLTTPEEMVNPKNPEWKPYVLPDSGKVKYIRCPIEDRTPTARDDDVFDNMISHISHACIAPKKPIPLVYIHCRGGHGRSAMVAAIMLCIVENIDPRNALIRVKDAHQKRKIMEPRWRKMGAPQTRAQKTFVTTWVEKYKVSTMIAQNQKYTLGDDGYYVVVFV
jgi:protein-tyrosine phosphatase